MQGRNVGRANRSGEAGNRLAHRLEQRPRFETISDVWRRLWFFASVRSWASRCEPGRMEASVLAASRLETDESAADFSASQKRQDSPGRYVGQSPTIRGRASRSVTPKRARSLRPTPILARQGRMRRARSIVRIARAKNSMASALFLQSEPAESRAPQDRIVALLNQFSVEILSRSATAPCSPAARRVDSADSRRGQTRVRVRLACALRTVLFAVLLPLARPRASLVSSELPSPPPPPLRQSNAATIVPLFKPCSGDRRTALHPGLKAGVP